jgi:UrcA family protein
MKNFALISVAVLSLTGFVSAHADSDSVPTMTVKYGDLDLTRVEGAAALYQRLEHAARTVCAPLNPVGMLAGLDAERSYEACLNKAVSESVSKVNKPLLTNYAAGKASPVTIKLASR